MKIIRARITEPAAYVAVSSADPVRATRQVYIGFAGGATDRNLTILRRFWRPYPLAPLTFRIVSHTLYSALKTHPECRYNVGDGVTR